MKTIEELINIDRRKNTKKERWENINRLNRVERENVKFYIHGKYFLHK